MKTPKFESPPSKAWAGSAMAVVGKFLYLAGGAQLKEFPNPRKVSLEDRGRYEPQSQVYRMDTSRSGSKWTDRGELRMPRDRFHLVPSINCNELYAIGGVDLDRCEADPQMDRFWAEVCDIKANQWNYHEIKRTGNCKSLPWYIHWYVRIPDTNEIYFLALDMDERKEKNYSRLMVVKLYHCDFKECCFYDEDFEPKFHNLLATVTSYESYETSDWVGRLDRDFSPLLNKPTLCGDNCLFFTGSYIMYCYKLKEKKWLGEPVHGLDFRRDIMGCYYANYNARVVYLGGGAQNFAVMCYDYNSLIVRWAKFKVSISGDIATASDITTIQKFQAYLEVDEYGCGGPLYVGLFAIKQKKNKKKKKKKKKKKTSEIQELGETLMSC